MPLLFDRRSTMPPYRIAPENGLTDRNAFVEPTPPCHASAPCFLLLAALAAHSLLTPPHPPRPQSPGRTSPIGALDLRRSRFLPAPNLLRSSGGLDRRPGPSSLWLSAPSRRLPRCGPANP